MLSLFSTNASEKEFSKLPNLFEKEFIKRRQRSGRTHFSTVQQLLEKVNICKTRLPFKLSNISSDDLSQMETNHRCAKSASVLDI